jgi:hypothetical protein
MGDRRAHRHVGFDRWVGRTFQDAEQRLAWWAEHKGRPPEEWLRANVAALAAQADAGDAVARAIVLQVLPEAPRATYESYEYPTGFSFQRHPATTTPAATAPAPSVASWLRGNQAKLQYDPQQHALRVTSATQPINPH